MVPRAHPFALRSGLSIVLCIALILTNLPQAAARFVATGHWPSAEGVAFAAQTTTTRASLTNAGAQANGPSVTLTGGDTLQEVRRYVSDDGRYVVFNSSAPNLTPGFTNNGNTFVRDTQLGTTTLVSVDISGNPAGSAGASISGDGRYVAFESPSANVVSGDTNGFGDVFVRDVTLGTTVRASVDSSGTQGAAISVAPYISSNGRYVVFRSDANLGGPAPGGGIYLRDLTSGTTDFISVGYDGHVANDFSEQPTVSDDGRYVSFVSRASNVASPKTNLGTIFDVYLRDRTVGSTQRISVGAGGVQGNAQSNTAQVSGDGTSVIFRSGAENLIPNDGNLLVDLFIRDLGAQLTSRIVENTTYGFASGDVRYIAFQSAASNLVPGDTNGLDDIFTIDRQEGTIDRQRRRPMGLDQRGWALRGLHLG